MITKVAVVTGARGAIGSAVVTALRESNIAVVALDKSSIPNASDDKLLHLQTELTSSREISRAIDHTIKTFGNVNILVNAAGITSTGSAHALEEAEWDRVIDINLKSVFLSCQAVLTSMKAVGAGRIINIGSILGKNGGNARPWIDPNEQQGSANVAYGAAKAGVHALTLYLARELASHGITVNAVAPGPIATAMTTKFPETLRSLIPLKRLGTTSEVAAAVCFLASDSASFITGEILDVNGGAWAD